MNIELLPSKRRCTMPCSLPKNMFTNHQAWLSMYDVPFFAHWLPTSNGQHVLYYEAQTQPAEHIKWFMSDLHCWSQIVGLIRLHICVFKWAKWIFEVSSSHIHAIWLVQLCALKYQLEITDPSPQYAEVMQSCHHSTQTGMESPTQWRNLSNCSQHREHLQGLCAYGQNIENRSTKIAYKFIKHTWPAKHELVCLGSALLRSDVRGDKVASLHHQIGKIDFKISSRLKQIMWLVHLCALKLEWNRSFTAIS